MKLPILSAKKVIKALKSIGFEITRQSGSHIIMVKYKDGKKFTVVVPNHDEIAKGTLFKIKTPRGVKKKKKL